MTNGYQAPAAPPQGLPAPECPLPLDGRDFRFEAGLRRLDWNEERVSREHQAFWIDSNWPAYRQAKLSARAERFSKYVCFQPGQAPLMHAAAGVLAGRLAREYPGYFCYRDTGPGSWELGSGLTGQVIRSGGDALPLVDALALEVQEDIALMSLVDGAPRLVGLHVCFPNHWAPADKLGRGFAAVHAEVPGFEPLSRHPTRLHQALSRGDARLRFAWGLATDTRLNHHPEPLPGVERERWAGRRFDPEEPALWLRVERQVMVPVPGFAAYVFLIRSCFHAVADLERGARERLRHVLTTMDPATRAYKGLTDDIGAILDWLDGLD